MQRLLVGLMLGSYYQRNFTPVELVGDCVDAAFAASLHI